LSSNLCTGHLVSGGPFFVTRFSQRVARVSEKGALTLRQISAISHGIPFCRGEANQLPWRPILFCDLALGRPAHIFD
jgi:hypothetical protein